MGRDEKGAILIFTLLTVVVGVIALTATGVLSLSSISSAARWREDGSALYVAEAGVVEALYRLKYGRAELEQGGYPADSPSFAGAPGPVGRDAIYHVWVWEDEDDRLDYGPASYELEQKYPAAAGNTHSKANAIWF